MTDASAAVAEGQYEVSFCARDQKTNVCARHSQCELPGDEYTLMNGSVSDASGAYSLATEETASGQFSRSVSIDGTTSSPVFYDSEPENERRLYAVVNPRRRERNRSGREPYTFANDAFRRSPSSQVSVPPSIPEASPYLFAGDEQRMLSKKNPSKEIRPAVAIGISVCALLFAFIAIVIGVLVLLQIQSINESASRSQKSVETSQPNLITTPSSNFNDISTDSVTGDRCLRENSCHPEGGVCVSIGSDYGCICKNGWTGNGRNCTEISYSTCAALRKVVGFNSGYYKISPDPTEKIPGLVIKCVMERDRGITEIEHDSEAEILVNGCDSPGCYSRNITYRASMEQIEAIIAASNHCTQYIKYSCYHSALASKEQTYAWWISRQGTKETHWAEGAAENSCACSLKPDATCPGCYCNINDSTNREDAGYITNKTLLPIMQLRYGDVGESWEEGFHTLGRLRCYD